jgi:hypothetical protein
MRRSVEEAFAALRQQVSAWAGGSRSPELRVFVYPPEWEAVMLARFPSFAADCAKAGWPIEMIDVGAEFLAEIERRRGFVERLAERERADVRQVLHDLGVLAERYLERKLGAEMSSPAVCRLLVNTSALGTFVSYSALTSRLYGDQSSGEGLGGCAVLAFPGESDEGALNLLRLRRDTNYRVPRI